MNEKIIIEGQRNKTLNMILGVAPIVFFVISLINFVKLYSDTVEWLKTHYAYSWNTQIEFYVGVVFLIISIILLVLYIYCAKSNITVTNKRVYGRAVFGKRVDLPMDSVSAVSITSFLNGISVATSAGTIKFKLISNNAMIHQEISKQLVARQAPMTTGNIVQQNESTIKQLEEYKKLLDNGTITQEEFDMKKKQLLGL